MRNNIAKALLDPNTPEPMVWAVLLNPYGAVLKGDGPSDTWRRVQTSTNGGFYERGDGLQARCRGLEVAPEATRWWHVIVGRKRGTVSQEDVRSVVDVFFPENAMVMQVHLPTSAMDQDDLEGTVMHLWWSVDGTQGVPPVGMWEREASFDLPEPAPTHD